MNSQTQSTKFSVTLLIPLVLAVAIFFVFQFMTFVTQPELGDTTISLLTESRGNNEFDLNTNGLVLMPISAGILLILSLWNMFNPQVNRATSILTTIIGIIMLEYFAIFAMDYTSNGGDYINAMGGAFWGLLILSFVAIFQVLIPRPKPIKQYQLRNMVANQEGAIIIALVILLIVVGISNPRYLATRNILDVLEGNAYIAVAAIGMSMVIITGNIDISVGSLIGLLAIVSGRLVVGGAPVWVSWLAPLVLGALIGALIGFLVAYAKVPSIVVTLGMFSILKGVLIFWTNGQRVTGMPEEYYLSQQDVFGVGMPIILMITLTILAALWMRYSSTGRSFYAIGGNAEAARLSGIPERKTIMMVFMINGVFVGIASVMYATQLQIIQATPPPALELAIITAVVVGGVSILGGTGTVIGAMLAAILLNAIRSGMIFINVSPFWIQAVQGALILITVLIDLLRRRDKTV